MRAPKVVLFVSSLALSACGGSTTGVSFANVDAFNAKSDTHTNPLIAELRAGTALPLNSAPIESSASMSGTFVLQAPASLPNVNEVAGQIDMSANFASGTVSGSMSRFVEAYSDDTANDIRGNVSYSGAVNVGAGFLDDINATGTGSVTGTDGTTYNVSASLSGDIIRRAAGELAAFGIIDATATSNGTPHAFSGTYGVTE